MSPCKLPNTYIPRTTYFRSSLIVYGGYVGTCSEWAEKLKAYRTCIGKRCNQVGVDKAMSEYINRYTHHEPARLIDETI